ncbi:MAG: hypothetical protein ACQERD_00270 [Campylobacterota bacterium]
MCKKNIAYSCLTCKSEITLTNKEKSAGFCPECQTIDLEKMSTLLNKVDENQKQQVHNDIKLKEIEYPYKVKLIYEFKVFKNLISLLKGCGLPKFTDDLSVDKKDLASVFNDKPNSNIYLLTLDLRSFNELDLNKLNYSKVVLVFYIKKGTPISLITDLLDNFNTKDLSIDLIFGVEQEDILQQEQMVDIYYA